MLDWKEYVSEVQEVLRDVTDANSYKDAMEALNEGLETNVFSTDFIGDKRVMLFDNIIFWDGNEIRKFFTIQPKVPRELYTKIYEIVSTSEARTRFVEYTNRICSNQDIARIAYVKSAQYTEGYMTAVCIENNVYTDKEELLLKFNGESNINLKSFEEKCNKFEYQGDDTLICDGIALITKSRKVLETPMRNRYALEGLLDVTLNTVTWVNIMDKAFAPVKTGTATMKLLRIFLHGNYAFYKQGSLKDNTIVEKPYPIGILSDNTFIYAYKDKELEYNGGV